MKKFFKFLYSIIIKEIPWFISIFYLEFIFLITVSKSFNFQLIINIFITSLIISKLLTILISFFNEKVQMVLFPILIFLLGTIFSVQGVFYKIFKVYFSLYNLELKDQIKSFMTDAIKMILKNSIYIILFLLPFIIFLIIRKKIKFMFNKSNYKQLIYIISSIFMLVGILQIYINCTKNNRYSNYELYYNVNNVSLNIKKLGVINSYILDLNRLIFGFTPKKIKYVSIPDNDNKKEEVVEEIKYDENILELKLDNTGNYSVDLINDYIRNDKPTLKNKYTGKFKGYNLVYITAEGFSEIAIDKDLTPTLYKLTHSGFMFNKFYTPNNLSTIGGEFQSLTGLYPDYSILRRWRDGTNYFPFGLANTFQKEGYATYAYHNNSYVFQDRNQYLASQGFNNFLACYNGLENRMNCQIWPQSDNDMINVTVDDYINNDAPFLAYYMTVSGHLDYTFDDNYMAYKNKDLVNHLDKNENAKAYVATQIELDRALESLINSLESHGKLDNTVIVLLADHYPYGLDKNTINSLSSYERDDIEINHNSLIIWNNKLEDTTIDKACMAVDVIPTVYNLFGINYDSRLFSGRDILSTSFGVAVLADRSWVINDGVYHSNTNSFVGSDKINQEYIDNVNNIVNNRLNISKLILENDYYRYIFG